jgi:hypothetical protein
MISGISLLFISNPWVQPGEKQVGHKIHDDEENRRQEDQTLSHGVIALFDTLDE